MPPLPVPQVLLLEKDYTNRLLITEYLEQCNYGVFPLADERKVFESLESYQPDILVLNLKMPAIDGFTIIEQVRAHVSWRSLPILVLTSYTLSKYQRRAYKLGADAYLTKPVVPSVLSASIAQLVTSVPVGGRAEGRTVSLSKKRYSSTRSRPA